MSPRGRPDDAGRSAAAPLATGRLGMRILLASLTMLFGASIVAYLLIRLRAPTWPPPGMPHLPEGLWVSTAILLASSATVQWALRGARRDDQRAARAGMVLTTLLACAFLVSQTLNWFDLVAASVTPKLNLYAFTFFTLTALHAAHVLGGLLPLVVVSTRALRGAYSAAFHPGIVYCAMYWHFLDVVWLVLFSVLYLAA